MIFLYDIEMKLKLFIQLYFAYILIIINLIICSFTNLYLPFFLGIFYFLLIKEFNRTGFVNRKVLILTLINLLYLSFILGISHYLIYLTGGIELALFLIHIPYRTKISKLFYQVELNQAATIFCHQILQSNRIIEFGFEIRQSEIDWLSKRILFSSKELKEVHWVYLDNEIIGNNFHVNIV